MTGSDDLASLFAAEPGQVVRHGQGQLLQFNPDTFENRVLFRGAVLDNVNIKSSVEALTFHVGDVVSMAGFAADGGGFSSWWIDGRIIIPGPGAAEQAIAFTTTTLGKSVAAAVFADRIHFATDNLNADVSYPSAGFVDPDVDGNPGPAVTDINVTAAGRMIVTLGAGIDPDVPTSAVISADMGFEITGASTVPASGSRAAGFARFATGDDQMNLDLSRTELISGLNEGTHTVTAKYQAQAAAGTPPSFARFSDRYIQVIAF